MKAIAKDPAPRYETWEEFGQELAEVWKKTKQSGRARAVRHRALQPLPHLSFFKDFPENELWEVLRLSKWRKFPPDTVLIKEGDHGDSFFILAGGYVRVTRGKRTLNVLSAGDCFGEMAYLATGDSPHRSATVTTTSDCIVVKIRAEDLRAASLSVPAPLRRALPQHAGRAPREAANQQLAVMSVEVSVSAGRWREPRALSPPGEGWVSRLPPAATRSQTRRPSGRRA